MTSQHQPHETNPTPAHQPQQARSGVRGLQQPSAMPWQRYRAFPPVDLPDRTWPAGSVDRTPRWLSTDLRDGNQALIDPMSPARKMTMFQLLVRLGYKEIEVGFPSASQTDFDFVRELVTGGRIPDDVRISVLTQAREDLIERTVSALVGAPRSTVHLYNATAPLFRRVVFGVDAAECRAIAVRGTEIVMKHAEEMLGDAVGDGDFGYQYCPEIFTGTELDFAVDVCEAVSDVSAARGRSRDHPQPAGHRRDVDAERLRRPDRVLLPPPDPSRAASISPCTRTTTAARPSLPPSWR